MPREDCDEHPSPPLRAWARRCKPGRLRRAARSTLTPLLFNLSIEYGKDGAQLTLHGLDRLRIQCRSCHGAKLTALPVFVDLLARAVNRVLLRIEKLLDEHHELDLTALVNPVSRAVLRGMKKLELTLPITQHVRFQIRQCADVSNGEEFLHRFLRFHRSTSARSSLVMRAAIALRAD